MELTEKMLQLSEDEMQDLLTALDKAAFVQEDLAEITRHFDAAGSKRHSDFGKRLRDLEAKITTFCEERRKDRQDGYTLS